MKGIVNHMRAVDVLQAMPEVDASSIGVIGHSLGGHNSLFVAAFDPRIRAVVTSCGFTSFAKYKGGDLKGWSHAGYMPRIATLFDNSPKRMPFDFKDVFSLIAPRPVFINAPIGDSNFEVSGVRDTVTAIRNLFGDNLQVVYPDAGHSFPKAAREQAYAFLEKVLVRRR
jgi:dipeptidyl aminopeptidase/acylaminoacyl peptidase